MASVSPPYAPRGFEYIFTQIDFALIVFIFVFLEKTGRVLDCKTEGAEELQRRKWQK